MKLLYIIPWLFLGLQANSASGIAVSDECKTTFLELKAKRNYRFITFKIDDNFQQVSLDKVGNHGETYDDFISILPESDCRYADRFKRELDGIQVELQATDLSEVSWDILKARAL
ncbi:hypothetical protein ACS0TY_019882 [Phlomoides rotata]